MKLLACLLSSFLLLGINQTPKKATSNDNEQQNAYSNFEKLPDGFELFSRSDKTNTEISFSNGEMSIAHANTNAKESKYYGGLVRVDKTKYFRNFSLEMNFKVESATNDSSFFGITYHSQLNSNFLSGYLSKYQYDGSCHFIGINDTPSFSSELVGSTKKLDGNYHTVKIEVKNNDVSQYLDNALIGTSDLRNKDSSLGYTRSKGEMGLLVSNMKLSVKSITITGKSEAPSDTNPIISTYQDENNIVNAPTVVVDCKRKEDLDFSSSVLPSNAILHVNDNLDVIDEEGAVIDSFDNILNDKLKHQIIPLAYITSSKAAKALTNYLKENTDVIDFAVASNDASLLKEVKKERVYIRAIYDAGIFDKEVTRIANKNYALTIMINEEDATIDNIEYIHARFKATWVKMSSTGKASIHSAINSGAYGIVSSNYMDIYDAYQEYDENSFVRRSFNPAHRGLPNKYNENSLNGCMAAIESGATHIEIDAYLTSDNEIVIMHDSDVKRTTNGTGNIENMTLAQVKSLELDLKEPHEEIPTLREIMEGIIELDTDSVVILEIKSAKTKLVDYLKELIDEYEFDDRIVVISFSQTILKAMKNTLPEIPTCYLGAIDSSNFATSLQILGECNSGVDTQSTTDTNFNEQYLRDHGIIGYYWTFQNVNSLVGAASRGFVGLTTNEADGLTNSTSRVTCDGFVTEDKIEAGDPIEVNVITYGGKSNKKKGKVFCVEEYNDHYEIIAKYSTSAETRYTQKVVIEKKNPDVPASSSSATSSISSSTHSSGGCGGEVIATISGMGCLLVLALSLIAIEQKRKRS